MPELSLEGTASEYSFADVRDAVPNYESLKGPFANGKADGHMKVKEAKEPKGSLMLESVLTRGPPRVNEKCEKN